MLKTSKYHFFPYITDILTDLQQNRVLTNRFSFANGPLHFAQTKDLGNEDSSMTLVNVCGGNLSISPPFPPFSPRKLSNSQPGVANQQRQQPGGASKMA